MYCQSNPLWHLDEHGKVDDHELYDPSLTHPSSPPDLTYNIYKTGLTAVSN